MQEYQENAGIPLSSQVTATQIVTNDKTVDKSKTRYLWFCGNTIASEEQFSNQSRSFGGIHLGHIQTLHADGNDGMIYRCRITPMVKRMLREPKGMIPPSDRQNWESSFIIKNGKLNPATRQWEDIEVSDLNKDGVPLTLYKGRLPGDEINFALRRSTPNGTGGVVELTALKGKTISEVREYQMFFFPKWKEIENGVEKLPATIKELEAHLRARISAIRTEIFDESLYPSYEQTGREMIGSCAAFTNWGTIYLKKEEEKLNNAKVKGTDYTYPDLAELVLVQLNATRKDDLAATGAAQTNDVVAEMRLDREERKRTNDLEAERLAFEKEKLAFEKEKMERQTAGQSAVIPKDAEIKVGIGELSFEGQVCADKNGKGEPCGSKVSKEIAGQYFCHNHPK